MTVNQITPGAMPLCANIFLKEIYYNEEIKKKYGSSAILYKTMLL